ncbi:MAG: MBG domain-containing protein [Cyclobacteriaceae bacterium]
MKTTISLFTLFLSLLFTNGSAQTIRFLGTTLGSDNLYMIQADGSGYVASNPFPSTAEIRDGLLEASDKLIYGVSYRGGANDKGFIFRSYADGRNYQAIKVFDGTDAQFVNGDLIEASDGKLYGTSSVGSTTVTSEGTIFRLDRDGSNFEVLRYMNRSNDGDQLDAGLVEASDGFLYGTTAIGGNHDRGTIFKISKEGTNFSVVYHFNTAAGCCTSTRLVEYNGKLYGLNGIGGGFGNGAVYSYDLTTGVYAGEGGIPNNIGFGVDNNFIISSGFLYGQTTMGASNNKGSIFKFEIATGTYTLLHDKAATAGLVSITLASDGNLYGTTQFDGANSNGTLFKLTTSGVYSTIYSTTPNNGQPLSELFEIVNTPPTLITPAQDVTLVEGDESYTLDLSTLFSPSDEPAINVEQSISGNTNSGLFTSLDISNGILTITFDDEVSGTSDITLRATDSKGDFTETTFTLTIDPVADDPSITNTTSIYKTLNTSGLVVSKNATDGSEVTHFKVTNILDGDLYLNDGLTSVSEGDFVTFIEGALGLKFAPSKAGTSSFDIQAATSNNDSGLGGNTVTAIITASKASLIVTAENKTRKYGEPDPVFTFTYNGFIGGDDIAVIDVLPSASTSTTVTTPVGAIDIVPSGAFDDNYEFSFVNGTMTIERADLIVAADDQDFRYGDTSFPTLTYSYSGFVNGEDASVLDFEPSGISTTAMITSSRGMYPITVTQDGSDNNYNFNYEDGVLIIGKALLTTTANNFTKIYGKDNPALTFSYAGFVNGEDVSVLDTEPTIATSAIKTSDAGTYDITLSGGSDDNYEFVLEDGILTIQKASLRLIATDATVVYGGQLPSLSFGYSGFVNGENAAVIDRTPSGLTTTASTTSNAGVYPIRVNQDGSDNNYSFTYVDATLTISKASLMVAPLDVERSYGEANPAFVLVYTNLLNGDEESDIDTAPSSTTTADETSKVGIYPITLSGGSDNNYDFIFSDGKLTINKANLTVTPNDVAMVYGDVSFPELTLVYSGFANDEDESVLESLPTVSTAADISSQAGTYPLEASEGMDDNYSFNYVDGSLTVARAPLTIRATDAAMVYGSQPPSLSFGYEGFANGDTEADIVPPTASTAVEESTVPGVYAITLTGGSADNYELVLEDGELTVTKTTLTVTANNKAIDYNESLPGLDYVYSGFVNGEDGSALELEPAITTEAVEGANAGTYSIAVAGGQSALYEFSYVEGTLTINKLQATITVSELEQVLSEDGNQPVVTTDPAGLSYIITYDGLEEVPSVAGEYEVTITIDDPNYEGSVSGTLTIEGAVTAIEELPVIVSLYPNPVQHILSVEVTNSTLEEVEVYNLSGVLMMGSPLIGHKAEIDVQAWPVGIYLIRLTASNGETLMQRKFIKE